MTTTREPYDLADCGEQPGPVTFTSDRTLRPAAAVALFGAVVGLVLIGLHFLGPWLAEVIG